MHTPVSPEKRTWIDSFGLHIPVAIVLAIYLASNWIQLDGVSKKHQQLVAAEKQLARDDVKREMGNAEQATTKLEALVHEVVALAPTNANARKIADEFHLSVPNAAPVSAPAPTAPAVSTEAPAAKPDAPKVAATPASEVSKH